MKLENQVCSLEPSQRLRELGVPQESLFCWVKGKMSYRYEGEFSIEQDDNYFLFEEVGYKITGSDFSVDAGGVGETDEEYEKYLKRKEKLEMLALNEVYSAFTVAELGEMLPDHIKTEDGYLQMSNGKIANRWHESYIIGTQTYLSQNGETEADARAKMLIYLLENKLITL